MKKENNKYFAVLVILAVIGIALIYQSSYAKYVKGLKGNVDVNMAKWNIKVNNEMIMGKDTLTNSLTATFPETAYKKANVIAPGATGYFDIVIDPSDVDVAFNYEIKLDRDSIPANDIKINQYELMDTNAGPINYNDSTGIVGNVPLNSLEFTVRVYVNWVEGPGETMNNAADTQVAKNYSNIPVDVNIKFIQAN